MMSLLCEETYSQETISQAVGNGNMAVIEAVRTNNMYPPTLFAEPIAEAIVGLFSEGGNLSAELFFDDKELFTKEEVVDEDSDDDSMDDDVDVDDLLEEDMEEDFDDDDEVLKDLKTSLQVADDDSPDIDDPS